MLEFDVLVRSRSVTLGEAVCRAPSAAPSEEEVETDFSLVFPRRGTFTRHVGHHRVVATPAVALLLNAGEAHRTSHPRTLRDESIFITLSPGFAAPFLDDRSGRFPVGAAPTTAATDLAVRSLLSAATHRAATPLEVEEVALHALEETSAVRRRRQPTAHQRAVVADAEEYLAECFGDDADLPTIARVVGSSPHHLSRLFRDVTGVTMSWYRTQLRIRSVFQRISEGARDLATVAVDAGFYDHAHMTNTIQRHAGRTPSQVRHLLAPRGVQHASP